jgi:acyl-coenzyme A thioesterase PaaI-like protein
MFHDIIQHTIEDNHCVGCGPDNPHGLKIRSVWSGVMETRCSFEPQPHMAAASPDVLNGGVIATVIDCHAVCTAVSYGRRTAGAASADDIMYATGALDIRYLNPTPIHRPVEVKARITGVSDRKVVLECTLSSDGQVCAEATVTAVRVREGWDAGLRHTTPPPAQTLGGWTLRGAAA